MDRRRVGLHRCHCELKVLMWLELCVAVCAPAAVARRVVPSCVSWSPPPPLPLALRLFFFILLLSYCPHPIV